MTTPVSHAADPSVLAASADCAAIAEQTRKVKTVPGHAIADLVITVVVAAAGFIVWRSRVSNRGRPTSSSVGRPINGRLEPHLRG